MNICVLGDSHCAALKRGWEEIHSQFPDCHLTFFASRGITLSNLKVADGKLWADKPMLQKAISLSSGGKTTIDIAEYDIFLIYGLQTSANFFDKNMYLSKQLKDEWLKGLIQGTAAYKVFNNLRRNTKKFIFVGHAPLLAADIVKSRELPKKYLAGIEILNHHHYLSNNASLVAQPTATIVNGWQTDPIFSIGSKRLNVGVKGEDESHPAEDKEHMNDNYGKLWMHNFLQLINNLEH